MFSSPLLPNVNELIISKCISAQTLCAKICGRSRKGRQTEREREKQKTEKRTGINTAKTIFAVICNWTAIKLQQDFDALSEFSSGHICAAIKD